MHKVILKKLENIENADRSWFDEVRILKFIKLQFTVLTNSLLICIKIFIGKISLNIK